MPSNIHITGSKASHPAGAYAMSLVKDNRKYSCYFLKFLFIDFFRERGEGGKRVVVSLIHLFLHSLVTS